MLQRYLMVFVFGCFLLSASAQRKAIIGYVRDSLTHLPVSGSTVSNPAIQKKIRTDAAGRFLLEVAPNDLIYVFAPGYRYDTLRYSPMFKDTLMVYLPLSGDELETVIVQAGYEKYRADSAQRRRVFESDRGRAYAVVDNRPHEGFGLVINLDRFFKNKYKHKRKGEQVFASLERQAYIDFRFSRQMVAFYTGLKGEALLRFIGQYSPSYEWLRQHPAREQVVGYISEKLKEYRKATRQPNGVM